MKKGNKGNMLSWLVLGLVGVLTIIFKTQVKNVLYIIAGAGLMVMAAISIISCIRGKSKDKNTVIQLAGSAILFIIGLLILCNPSAFDKFINIIIGVVIALAGLMWLFKGLKAKDVLTIVLGAIAVILGIFIAVNSSATNTVITIAGIGLIYVAVSGIISELRTK